MVYQEEGEEVKEAKQVVQLFKQLIILIPWNNV